MTGIRDQFVDEPFLARRLEATKEFVAFLMPSRHANWSAGHGFANGKFNLVKLNYCIGTPLDEIQVLFRDACESAIETGAYLGLPASTYPIAGMLRLFEFDGLREQMIPLTRHQSPEPDPTVRRPHDFLMGFPGLDDDANYPEATVSGPAIHVRTWWLIEAARADRDRASGMLEELVTKHWGRAIRGQPWFGLHSDPRLGYAGYWCYGIAAVAKMFGLDDSGLEGNKYYPYDLAHFRD